MEERHWEVAMNVINVGALEEFWKKHNQARAGLLAWLKVAKQASWEHLMDVKRNYPSSDGGVKDVYTVFNIKGNSYRLVTLINYRTKTIAVMHVFTHAKYDQWSKS